MPVVAERKHDGINWHAFAHVDKFSPDQCRYADRMVGQHIAWYQPGLRRAQRRGWGGDYTARLHEVLVRTGEPEDGFAEVDDNLLTTQGLTTITSLLNGVTPAGRLFPLTTSAGTSFSGCGVGDNTTAAVVGDTKLGADAANAWYQAMDTGNPTTSAGVMTGITTYASGNANFAWQEWCWISGTGVITAGATLATRFSTNASASMWNHKIASLGTKASGAAWVFTTTITLS